ncbi:hypothetical protein GGR88_000443 [Sphingomonas jejuensis]|uniref:Uncharacterized protein n=1 Tax=Sphingomonas jejuensis TaxID=904715 RepID=A0ABX0XI19_9SPHN|nr:hypothetical protein [Sphingomonas jejuensis]NJC32969.1 hypothetical protein [Sphingomonas jejuensis]
MTTQRRSVHRTAARALPDLPSRIGLFGSMIGAAADATPFDIVIAVASGDPTRR